MSEEAFQTAPAEGNSLVLVLMNESSDSCEFPVTAVGSVAPNSFFE
jgi:hypothetical protein